MLVAFVSVVTVVASSTANITKTINNNNSSLHGDATSALLEAAGCTPACVAYSLTLCSHMQEQSQFIKVSKNGCSIV